MTTCRLLFVYGTLRRQSPHPMARYLARHARYVGTARVAGRLYDLGPYPGMLPAAEADDFVHGDLFDEARCSRGTLPCTVVSEQHQADCP